MSKKVLIVGYYGFGNSGDDAILKSICDDIKSIQTPVDIDVLSKDPKETTTEYNVGAYNRFSLVEVLRAIKKCDVLLMGGGTLIQDLSSTKSIYYYLMILFLAKLFGKNIMLFANGIGPISKKSNRRLTKFVLNKVDLITLRESLSEQVLKELGVKKPQVEVTADPVFNLKTEVVSRGDITIDKPYVVVMVRPWKQVTAFIKPIAQVCDYISKTYNKEVVFIPMKYPLDVNISKEILGEMSEKGRFIEKHLSEEVIFDLIKESDMVIAMRLHALIYGAIQNIPMIGVEYDPKIAYYLNEMQMPLAGTIYDLDCDEMIKKVDHIFNHYGEYKSSLTSRVEDMQKKAKRNIELLEALIK